MVELRRRQPRPERTKITRSSHASASTSTRSYHSDNSDDELTSSDDEFQRSGSWQMSSRSLRPIQRSISYREVDSSEEEFQPSEPESQGRGSFGEIKSRVKPKSKSSSRSISKRKSNSGQLPYTGWKRTKASFFSRKPSYSKLRPTLAEDSYSTPPCENIPPWHTLPYEILFEIFVFASHPLHDPVFHRPTSSVKWLLDASLVCKRFTEPALSALYYSAPLGSSVHSSKLLQTLALADSSLDYRVKIKKLELEWQTLAYSSGPPWGHIDLVNLVKHMPLLHTLHINHSADEPPYRGDQTRRNGQWTYPEDLFDALEESDIRLWSFIWNTRMIHFGLLRLQQIHSSRAFQSLRTLKIINFGPAVTAGGTVNAPSTLKNEDLLNIALDVLPQLKSLCFQSCPIVNKNLLGGLPRSLERLTMANCENLTSELLSPFLTTHGSNLRELILNHNQCMGLSFLTTLSTSCPRLEILEMDLQYYSSSANFDDSEPLYDALLWPGEVPAWPTSLQKVSIVQMRNWEVTTAEAFFTSIIESSESMVNLRYLVLKAILKIGWRERAIFRKKWIGRLKKVYQRHSAPPSQHYLVSTHKPYSTPDTVRSSARSSENEVSVSDADARSKRKFYSDSDDDSSNMRPPKIRRSSRLEAKYVAELIAAQETSPELTEEAIVDDKRKEDYIQGRCEVVDIRIDNLRPTEEQFNEGDFLDSEGSDDGEWNGEDW